MQKWRIITGKSESQGYKTPWKASALDTNFPDNIDCRLVRCQSDLKDFISEIKDPKVIAFDTETNHVDWGYGHLVGMSCSINSNSGWYLPFRHEEYERNLPLELLPKLFNLIQGKQVLMYNAPFDMTMFNKEGWDCFKLKILDVMGLCYLMDTNIHLPSLKDMALHFLGRKAPTFEETLNGKEHFGWVNPEDGYKYACFDTANTFGLFKKLYPRISTEAPKALALDTNFVPILLKLCNTKLPVRDELVNKLIEHYTVGMKTKEAEIFKELGYPFNIKSNPQLERAFKQKGITTGYTTDKGNMSLKAEILALIADKYPFVKEIITYKSMSSTLSALKKFKGKTWIRCNYEMYNTVSGRMSSGTAKDETKMKLPKGVRPFFDPFNAQNFLKAKEIWYRGIYKPDDPYNILGYRFEPIEKKDIQPDDLVLEAMDYKGNPRRLINACIKDENGNIIGDEKTHYWVKADYGGAELRLACLFSQEPILMEAFLKGIDPHTNTAKAMFGVTDKVHRAKAKTCIGDNTLIQTNHGWKYPKDLVYGYDKLVNEKNEYVNWNMLVEPHDTEMYHVHWSNGIIEDLHEDHKVGVWTGKEIRQIPLKDITSDMQVICTGALRDWKNELEVFDASLFSSKYSTSKYRSIKINIQNNYFAYLIGLYLGDGNVDIHYNKHSHAIRILVSKEDIEYHSTELKKLGIPHTLTKHSKSDVVYTCTINCTPLALWFMYNFGRISEEKYITPDIYKWYDKKQLTYLLAGIIDSDGAIHGRKCTFVNTNPRLISDVAILCNTLGIICDTKTYKTGITTLGKRTYTKKDGTPLRKTINLILKDYTSIILPIRRSHKHSYGNLSDIGWYFNKEVIPVEKYAKLIQGNKKLSYRLTNIRKGNRCTRETFGWIQDVNTDFIEETGLQFEYYPISLLYKERYTGSKYVIEVDSEEHLYKGNELHSNSNFSNLYGGSSESLARASGLPLAEADELWHKYWDTMKVLKAWMVKEHKNASITGKCATFIGRPRRLSWYFSHPKLSMRSFGKRSVISHKVQGSLGELIKLALINSHEQIFDNPDWKDNYDAVFTMVIHDEIDSIVRKERLNEYLDTLLKLSKVQLPDWSFPLEMDVDLGYSYGFVVGIKKGEDGNWKIKFKKGSDVIG